MGLSIRFYLNKEKHNLLLTNPNENLYLAGEALWK